MRRLGGFLFFAALATGLAGCSPYNVDMSLEGVNWYVIHPRLYGFHYPYANPGCTYYDYPDCTWRPDAPQPSVSAVEAPAVVPKLDEVTY
jgi:hypothetical protein